jgi:bacillithiol biosynthesis cysteine-adding enzyme BshC
VSSNASESPSRLAVDVRRFPWIRRLAADYVYDFQSVAPFFAGDPADRTAWSQAIARVQAHERPRAQIASAVGAQLERRGAPAPALDAARALADRKTAAIVTGQQAGLFGGPLYTLLKALSAIKLAEKVARDHQIPAVAVFWIEGEDHDWDEVRSCSVFDEHLATRTVALPPELMLEPCPVASVRLDDSVTSAIAELEQSLAATEFREALVGDLRRFYTPGTGMAEAFGRWMDFVLGSRGLVVYDASDPDTKGLVSGIFTRELLAPGETSRRAAGAGAELSSRGYHAQAQPQDGSPALFALQGGREPIRADGGRLQIGGHSYTASELVEEAREHPAGFSPNVLLRPIVQDSLFPTVCYVTGPNEIGYLGQLRGVYELFGVPMPLLYPRASATIVDSAALRFLTRYQMSIESLQPRDEAALNALLKAQIPPEVESSFAAVSQTLESTMAELSKASSAVDPTLEGAAKSTLGRMQHDLHSLHGKIIQAAKRRDETLKRQFTRTRALAFPNGDAQERAIAFVSFLNQYGPALIDRLMAELPLDLGRHWVVAI